MLRSRPLAVKIDRRRDPPAALASYAGGDETGVS